VVGSLHQSVIFLQSADTSGPHVRDRRSLIERIDHLLAHEILSPSVGVPHDAGVHRSAKPRHSRAVTITVAAVNPTSDEPVLTHYGKFTGRWIKQGSPLGHQPLKDLDLNKSFVGGRLDDRRASSSATGGSG
jgi:hypothetical protein